MDFTFRLFAQLGPIATLLVKAILASVLGIFLLIAFIILRRWYRGRYFRRLNERTLAIRTMWDEIVSRRVAPTTWRLKPLDCEIVESILLDNIEVATPDKVPELLACLRSSGLLDMRIREARLAHGWKRRTALLALGRTRALEAIPALSEALDSDSAETRIAAVRGLGRTGLAEAAVPLLERLETVQLYVPDHTVKNALANCCRNSPGLLLAYMDRCAGPARELIARVLGEVATPELGDELLILAADPLPEVRASAARALANAKPVLAFPALRALAIDPEWFVRLRAVVALSSLNHSGRNRVLLRSLCDPNRFVRQRAAWALTRTAPGLESLLEQVVDTQDNYALQAFISELERSGQMEHVMEVLEKNVGHPSAGHSLLETLATGRQQVEKATTLVAAAVAGAR